MGRLPRAGHRPRPPRRGHLAHRRARRGRRRGRASWPSRPNSGASELERAGELPAGWAAAYPAPRDWKRALLRGAHAGADLGAGRRRARRPGGNPFGWHEPVLPPARHRRPARDRRAAGATRAPGSCWPPTSRRASRRSWPTPDIVAAPVSAPARAARRRAAWRSSSAASTAASPAALTALVLVTDRELFGTVRVRRPRAMRRVVPRDLLERLEPGDIVVHVDHGVARYAGLVRRPAGGRGSEERDFLELHFAEAGRIWVPVEQIERVSPLRRRRAPAAQPARRRGVAARPDARPQGRRRPRPRAAGAVRRARPRAAGGRSARTRPGRRRWRRPSPTRRRPTSCAPPSRSRRTWSASTPMDRLVVGDVGYGKTEVALRAAFKAIQAGTQVAVLVPTTVLAVAAPRDLQPALRGLPHHGPLALALRAPRRAAGDAGRAGGGQRGHRHRHPPAAQQGHPLPRPGPRRRRRGAALRRRRTRSASSS